MTPTAAVADKSMLERFRRQFPTSAKLYEQAQGLFPNGVTHDLRFLRPFPIYIDRAEGAYKWDVDGHRLIDYWSGHGSILLGHSHPAVVEAVQRQMKRATHPGGCHELEIEWGQAVQRLVPSAEKMRFVSSGTEATLMALRLARIFTGKPKVLKFAGHFHGWHDFLILGAESPLDQQPVPGVLPEVAVETVIIPPNDPAGVEKALAQDGDIGCVILEPTGNHFGAVPIRGDFLRALREITAKHQRLLIFDEVISGFRVHPKCAQGLYNVTPDLTTLAKILAGGLPGGCLAGRADIMAGLEFRPGKAKMRHPGTFNANPLSAAAGVATLQLVASGEPGKHATEMGKRLRRQLNDMFAARGHAWYAYGEFSGWKLLPNHQGPRPAGEDFQPTPEIIAKIAGAKNQQLMHAFRCGMLLHGVDVQGLGGMTTWAHNQADLDQTVAAVADTLELLGQEQLG